MEEQLLVALVAIADGDLLPASQPLPPLGCQRDERPGAGRGDDQHASGRCRWQHELEGSIANLPPPSRFLSPCRSPTSQVALLEALWLQKSRPGTIATRISSDGLILPAF